MNRSDFVDDSSAALGLSHSATSAETVEQRRNRARPVPFGGDTVSRLAGPLQQMDLADREAIARNVAADRDKKIRDLQRREGWTLKQAAEFVDKENAVPKTERQRLTAEEKRLKSTEHDMGMYRHTGSHGGSKSGRRREGKKGTWVCPECHLEGCGHRPVRRSGRKATFGRTLHLTARASAKTRDALAAFGLNTSDFLEVAAIAAADGVTFCAALSRFRSVHPCQNCNGRDALCVKCTSARTTCGIGGQPAA